MIISKYHNLIVLLLRRDLISLHSIYHESIFNINRNKCVFLQYCSAIHDRRFDPITLSELPYLQCTVSLLHSFESGQSWEDWEIGVHGITIEFIDPHSRYRRSATFLPEVAAHENWDKKQTMQHLIHKSGCTTGATTSILNAIKLTRYQSTTCSLTYDEYMKFKDPDMFRGITTDKSSNEEAITVPA